MKLDYGSRKIFYLQDTASNVVFGSLFSVLAHVLRVISFYYIQSSEIQENIVNIYFIFSLVKI